MTTARAFDLIILGGGPAGLAAALVAGRAMLRALVINDETPRNRVTKASHGFFTRDGAHALELLEHGKRDLGRYESVEYVTDRAVHVERNDDGFLATTAAGLGFQARRIVIATGQRDDLDGTGIPDLREVYGTSVFPCPFCDGFEHRGERIAVIGSRNVEHLATMVRTWSKDIHVFTNGASLDGPTRAALHRNGIPVHDDAIDQLVHEDGRLVGIRMGDRLVERDAGFIAGAFSHPSTPFADDLGVPQEEHPWGLTVHRADEFGRTEQPGVYVVGDAHQGFARLSGAATEGARCVEMIVAERAAEAWR